jgi:hypothetical protein
MDVHFQHTRVGRDAQHFEAGVARRLVTFEHDRMTAVGGRRFDGRHQFEIVLQRGQRWHEQVHDAVAHLRAQGGAGDPGRRFEITGAAVRDGCDRAAAVRQGVAQPLRTVAGQAGERCLHAPGDVAPLRQRGLRRGRIRHMHPGVVGFLGPGLGVEWKPVAERRIAGHQVAAFAAQEPGAALPAVSGRRARQRQYVADHAVEPLLEHTAHAFAFERIVQPGVERIDVRRQFAFAPQVVPDVFKRREGVLALDAEAACQHVQEARGVTFGQCVID